MDDTMRMAIHMKNNENASKYTPMIGSIESLPDLTIRLGDRILLYNDDVILMFDIFKKTEDNAYENINKRVVLLPCANNKFIVIGVVHNEINV